MDPITRAARLSKMLKQVSANNDVRELARAEAPPLERPPAFDMQTPSQPDATSVDSALDKVSKDKVHELTRPEMFALEAIIMPQNRPVVFVRSAGEVATYDDIGAPWGALNAPSTKAIISRLLPSIGRIELPLSPILPYGGTGFVVGDGLLMTNRHVAQLFSTGLGTTIRYQPGGSAIDFKRQVDTPDTDRSAYLKVVQVRMIHPYWDMAILRVEGKIPGASLPLSVVRPEDLAGDDVVVIGYPGRDDRNDLDLQDRIFERKYYVKRLQPGTIRQRTKIQSFETLVNAMVHDASTLGGDSGAAVIHVKSGTIVALHFAGEYLKANYAVPMYELARDPRVAAEKLNFVGSVAPTTDFDNAWRSVGAENVSRPDAPLVDNNNQAPRPQSPTLAGDSMDTHTWTVPLQITVSVGQPVSAGVRSDAGEGAISAEEAVVVDQDYSNREGYDPDFLGDISVALPTLTGKLKDITSKVSPDARSGDDPFELKYHHYSVYMNKQRRTAWFSAANVDGAHRPNIGKREGDRWYIDPRIGRSEQLGQEAFEHGVDRGHLTRREDTAWGKSVKDATAANNDTFHFTNCSLQVSAFNRGKDRWQGLEQFLLEQHAKKDQKKMIVITGPVFGSNDPVYQNDKMNYSVRCPLQYWKVCVLIKEEDGKPSATAFILGQDEIKDLPGFEETFDVAATQIKIAALEKRTGLDFGDLRDHDHFAQAGPGTLEAVAGEGLAARRFIRTMNDIVV